MRINEGVCDPDGLFYCGSMAYDQRQGAASLYRMNPDGTHFARGLEPGDDPLAGALFCAVPGVHSLPVREFAPSDHEPGALRRFLLPGARDAARVGPASGGFAIVGTAARLTTRRSAAT
jgi:hypothetical protein